MEWEEVLGNPLPKNPSEDIHEEVDSVEDSSREEDSWDAQTWKLFAQVLEGFANLNNQQEQPPAFGKRLAQWSFN